MTDNIIKLNNNNVLRFKIADSEGNDTGETLEFDMEDIELPLKLNDMNERLKKAKQNLKNQLLIIDKRQDVKGKKMLSKNDEDKLRVIEKCYKEIEEIYNMFLGENGVKKLLNGRKLTWTAFNEIDEIISTYIEPKLAISMDDITDKIKSKYSVEEEENVL